MRFRTFFVSTSFIVAVAVVLSLPAFAQQAAKSGPGESGQKAAVDAAGNLRQPTEAEAQELANQMGKSLSRSAEGLQKTRQSDGTVSVVLDERFESVSLARRNSDGTISQQCVGSKQEAVKFLTTDKAKPAAKRKPAPTQAQEDK